ncbi:Apolipoprotein N-acyltransferase [Sphingomonas guangdongensis]|uniref:Apolipoprotein N-acyltransferase n=1 Tax=Sphingomonas guangdongensis TaxID=1141890 RepID=A0A285QJ01_9SPHN|nr:apolipoprotein N-acyltransferase [Sphingomonas guangdongensis]SOB80052.1 Apolipoprotein N-acyltransferase [Sphingomonas guangdongensis]
MRFLLPLLLGAVAATGFAPLALLPATILAFAWWLVLVHQASSLKQALLTGWLFGLGHFTINNNWIQHAFDYQDRMPPVLGYGAVVLLAVYLAVYPMAAAGLAWRLASPRSVGADARIGPSFVLVAAAAWIVTEYGRATLFTGYAWNPLGTAWLAVLPVAEGARFAGTYAMSGLLVLCSGALVLLLGRRWPLPAGVAAVLALLLVAHAVRPPLVTAGGATAARVRVVQPNVEQQVHVSPDHAQAVLRRLASLSGRPGPAPRLVVWPEGIVDPYLEDGYPPAWYWRGSPLLTRGGIARVLGPNDRALVGGTALAFDRRGEITGAANAIFVVGPDARLGGRYDKAHLVPYGEYLPMRELLEPLGLSRLVAGEIDFLPGAGPRAVKVPGFGPVAMQICYEIIFSGQVVDRRGVRPRLLFNPSNDAWFGSWGPPQHLAQARMRAIEEGLPVVRSTPNGISAVIAADGRILGEVPRHVAGAVELPLPPAAPPTPFARTGNWMALAAVLILLALAMVARRR